MIADPDATMADLLERVAQLEDRVLHLVATEGIALIVISDEEKRQRGNAARAKAEALGILNKLPADHDAFSERCPVVGCELRGIHQHGDATPAAAEGTAR